MTAEGFMALVGWKYAEGKKALPFSKSFSPLGVTFGLTSAKLGSFCITNNEGRISDIVSAMASSISKTN